VLKADKRAIFTEAALAKKAVHWFIAKPGHTEPARITAASISTEQRRDSNTDVIRKLFDGYQFAGWQSIHHGLWKPLEARPGGSTSARDLGGVSAGRPMQPLRCLMPDRDYHVGRRDDFSQKPVEERRHDSEDRTLAC
jgi:hypothetical protein